MKWPSLRAVRGTSRSVTVLPLPLSMRVSAPSGVASARRTAWLWMRVKRRSRVVDAGAEAGDDVRIVARRIDDPVGAVAAGRRVVAVAAVKTSLPWPAFTVSLPAPAAIRSSPPPVVSCRCRAAGDREASVPTKIVLFPLTSATPPVSRGQRAAGATGHHGVNCPNSR